MAKQKIADLPQEEQNKIIAEMKELQIGGVYAAYTVEKALAAIEKKKAKLANPDEPGDDETQDGETPDEGSDETPGENEQTGADDEQNTGNDEQTGADDEQKAENMNDGEQTTEETSDVPNPPENPESSNETSNPETPENLPEGLSEDAKDFLTGESDKLPEDAEEITEAEAKKLQQKAEKAPKSEGICHICRSKVYNGVCSGCGFSLRG